MHQQIHETIGSLGGIFPQAAPQHRDNNYKLATLKQAYRQKKEEA